MPSRGDRVQVKRLGVLGSVRYIGNLNGKPGIFYGVELDEPVGKNNGSVGSERYFSCQPRFGTFVRKENLVLVESLQAEEKEHVYSSVQSQSHHANDQYMDEFEVGFRALQVASGGGAVSQTQTNFRESVTPPGLTAEYRQTVMQTEHRNARNVNWDKGPQNPEGTLVDLSDRPLLCSSVNPVTGECVVGGSDHGVYEFDLSNGKLKRKLYTQRLGHSEWVTCVDYSPDGSIISGGMDKKLCLWHSRRIDCSELSGHTHSISQVKVSCNGARAVSASYDKTIRIWDISSQSSARELSTLRGHKGPILEIALLDNMIISGSRDGVVNVWDMSFSGSSSPISYSQHKGHVTALCAGLITEGGTESFVSGDQAGVVRYFDTRHPGNKSIIENKCHPGGAINALQATPDGKIVSAGADNQIQVLEPRMNMQIVQSLSGHKDFIYSLLVVGSKVFSGAGNGMVLVHDIVRGDLVYGLGANQAGVRTLHTVGNTLVASGDDGNCMLYHFDHVH